MNKTELVKVCLVFLMASYWILFSVLFVALYFMRDGLLKAKMALVTYFCLAVALILHITNIFVRDDGYLGIPIAIGFLILIYFHAPKTYNRYKEMTRRE